MKALHLAIAAAVLLVAALVAFLVTPEGEHAAARRIGAREAGPQAGARGIDQRDAAAGGAPGAAPDAAPDRPRGETEDGPISITLRILCPDDAPASGADVVLDRGLDALRVKADEMGLLLVRDFAPGVYDLRARHGTLGGALRFETKGELDLGTLRLTAVVTVRGHVYGPRHEPVPNALVEGRLAIDHEPHEVHGTTLRVPQPEGVVASAATGADGAYELLLPTGEAYALRATARGLVSANRAPAVFDTDAAGIDFHLANGALIEGRVVDVTQAPVAGARVCLCEGWVGADAGPSRAETASGTDGFFSLVAAPDTKPVLAVDAAGYARHCRPVAAPATGVLVVLRNGVSLRLQAVEAGRTSIPAAHVSVGVTYLGGVAAGETDDQGRLLLEDVPLQANLTRGQRLFLWGGGYIPREIDLSVANAVDGIVDLGVVELTRGGVVHGRVLDKTTGGPIGGARVGAFGGPSITASSMASGTSAQDGSFRLEGVPLDAHTLTATHRDFVDEAVPTTGGGAGGPRLFLDGNREISRDVELVPAESVVGVVLAPDGSPASEADVAIADNSGMVPRLLGRAVGPAKSDANGAFALKGFRRGQMVTLFARHADYGISGGVDVSAGMGESAILRLTEPLIVEGDVADPGAVPIQGVRVEGGGRTAYTDAAGHYVLRDLPRGNLWFAFDHPDYHPLTFRAVITGSTNLGRTEIAPGETIAGVVVRGDGTPAGGVVLHATREPSRPATGHTSGSAETDAKGTFEIRGLAGGFYKLRTREPDAWSAEAMAKTGARSVRIVLLQAGKLVGRVTARGEAVAGATVRAEQPGGALLGWTRSAADGTFEILSVPPEAPFGVVVAHDRFAILRVEGVQASDRPRVFALEPGVEVSGEVVDGRGGVVAGAVVEVRVDGRDARRVTTDASGAFEAHGLAEGPITLRLAPSDGGVVPTGWIEVARGARNVRLVAVQGSSISGIVRNAAGRPARQVSVKAIDGEGRTASSAWVWQEDGSFELRGLVPGPYTVRAQQGIGPQASGAVAGVAAGTTGLEIPLGP